jgi:hypothetical protein
MTRRLAGLIAGLSMALAAHAAFAQQAAGDWLGTLTVNPTLVFHLAVHVAKTPQGGYAGTLDSLDRGAFDVPLADVASSDGALSFTVPSLKASYAGKRDPAAGDWDGLWTQPQGSWPLKLSRGTAPPLPKVAGLDGDWDGALAVSLGIKLRLAFHIATGPHGTLGVMNSIDQQTKVPVSAVARDSAHVKLQVALIGATFDGALDPSGQTMTGQWIKGNRDIPPTLPAARRGRPRRC